MGMRLIVEGCLSCLGNGRACLMGLMGVVHSAGVVYVSMVYFLGW